MNGLITKFFGVDGVVQTLVKLFRGLMLTLCIIVYKLIIYIYDIFIRLGSGEILTSSQVQKIYSRVTLIIGLFMLFKLLVSFVHYLLDPSKMEDKGTGGAKIILKCVIVVVLLGTTPFIFESAYKLQNQVLESNVVGKIILGTNNPEVSVSDFGATLSSDLFLSFYTYAEGEEVNDKFEWNENLGKITCSGILGEDMEILRDDILYGHSFHRAYFCLNTEPMFENEFLIDFAGHGLYALVVGVFVLYVMISYCLDVGMRIVQLGFLQLISPIPILSYLGEDKDGAFSKWVKRCVSTFLDLFIRLAIIYFVVFLISNLINNTSGSWDLFMESVGNPRGFTKLLMKVIIILGLLMFAKKAPELLKEVLPGGIGGNDYGFSLKKTKENLAPLGRAVGFGTSAIASGTVSGIARFNTNRKAGKDVGSSLLGAAGGVASGFVTGGIAGGKKGNMFKNVATGVKNRKTADNKYNDLITSGGTTFGAAKSWLVDNFNETKAQRSNRMIRDMEALSNFKSSLNKTAEEISFVSSLKTAWENMQQFDGESEEAFTDRKNKAQQHYKAVRKLAQEAALTGEHVKKLEKFKWTDHAGVEHIEVLSSPVEYNFASDDDDKSYLATMVSIRDQANDYSIAHNVQYYNEEKRIYEKVGRIENRDDISALSYKSENTKAELQRQGLVAAESEDRYFGVDSNASKK